MRAGQVLLDVLCGEDEVLAVVVVLLEAGGDGEDVGVKDDVVRRELNLGADKDVVRAPEMTRDDMRLREAEARQGRAPRGGRGREGGREGERKRRERGAERGGEMA